MALGTNDVNVDRIKETDAAVRQTPGLEKMTIKAKAAWCRGTMTRSPSASGTRAATR